MTGLPPEGWRAATLVALAVLFVAAGVAHVVKPRMFEAIVPPAFPAPRALVLISGMAEVLGGLGLLVPSVRTAAGWGLALLLVAVFPANGYMALRAERFRRIAPPWVLWARLPLQPLLIAAVLWASR